MLANSRLSMSSRSSVRVLISASNSIRALLSFASGPKGDVYIMLRLQSWFSDFDEFNKDRVAYELVEARYSVHPSADSAEDINKIKITFIYKGAPRVVFSQFTSAIKSRKGFTPLFVRMCPSLSSKANDFKRNSAREIDIGYFNTKYFTLIMGLFVGHSSRIFSRPRGYKEINIRQFCVKDIRIVLMWTYLAYPTTDIGKSAHVETHPENHSEYDPNNKFTQPMDEVSCINWFIATRNRLRSEASERLINNFKDKEAEVMLRYAEYSPSGNENDRWFIKATRNVTRFI